MLFLKTPLEGDGNFWSLLWPLDYGQCHALTVILQLLRCGLSAVSSGLKFHEINIKQKGDMEKENSII